MTVDAAGDLVVPGSQHLPHSAVGHRANQLLSVAGNGTCGYTGDGFNALSASISSRSDDVRRGGQPLHRGHHRTR